MERNQQKTKLIYMEHEDDYHLKKGAIRFVFFSPPELECSNQPIITMSVRMLETIL